jgi:probable rRNA maturation factor
MESTTVSITSITKSKAPNLAFSLVKDHILGKKYDLSLVFADKKTAQNLNIERRGKDYIPNILSFPYGKNFGEIFIHLPTAKKQYKDFEMEFEEYVLFLFIHGCLHLKGMEHSSTMENKERVLLKKFMTGPKK